MILVMKICLVNPNIKKANAKDNTVNDNVDSKKNEASNVQELSETESSRKIKSLQKKLKDIIDLELKLSKVIKNYF
jgi:hypothetical protein